MVASKMNSLHEPFGVIAGATGFLGSLLAKHYAAQGVSLILIGRDSNKLQSLKQELEKTSSGAIVAVSLDFNADYLPNLYTQTSAHRKRIKFFINTIGDQNPISPFLLSDETAWARSIHTNLIIPANLVKFFAQIFVENTNGSLILVSGGGATQPRINFSAYAAAKAALIRFVETFASEITAPQIRINAIAPGVMPSRMMEEIKESFFSGDLEEIKATEMMARNDWEPSQLLTLFDFLVSDESAGISGKLISAEWDKWSEWPQHIEELLDSDLYTLRRITGRDRNLTWGDV